MALTINHAILHTLCNNGAESIFSKEELDIDSEVCYEFISKHARRLLTNPAAREACFSAESQVYSMISSFQKGEVYFNKFALEISERLLNIMKRGADIPPADILITAFENGQKQYIAIIKLNYIECFTHRVVEVDSGKENRIVKNTAVLPLGGKVEEACLIPYDPMVLRILEQPYPVDGEEQLYFSKLFLECETEISKKETAEIIRDTVDEINAKYFGDSPEIAARVKCALIEEAEACADEDDSFKLENVARRVFVENEEVRTEFLSVAQDMGLPHEVKLDKSFVKQQFKMQSFKADNGIEIKCPAELFNDPDTIQFTTNSDGTVSITLKNLRRG